MIETRVHRKKTKLPKPWTSNIPKWCKLNTIKQNYIEQSAFHQTLQIR